MHISMAITAIKSISRSVFCDNWCNPYSSGQMSTYWLLTSGIAPPSVLAKLPNTCAGPVSLVHSYVCDLNLGIVCVFIVRHISLCCCSNEPWPSWTSHGNGKSVNIIKQLFIIFPLIIDLPIPHEQSWNQLASNGNNLLQRPSATVTSLFSDKWLTHTKLLMLEHR